MRGGSSRGGRDALSVTRSAAFIDRDGTIIAEKIYLSDPDRVELVPGTVEALHALREAGFVLVVVTNQAGIARGRYTTEDYHAVAVRLDEELDAQGIVMDATYFCPHHPDLTGACDCRKPATGMYRRAAAKLSLDVTTSFYVGDKITDVQPGITLGGQGILVRTGYGAGLEQEAPEGVWVVDDLREASRVIIERTKGSQVGS